MRRFKWTSPIIAFVVILFWYVMETYDQTEQSSSGFSNSVSLPAPEKTTSFDAAEALMQTPVVMTKQTKPLAQSLRGTDIEGGFRVGASGNLIIELGVKRYFDYFLATVGEESIEDITLRIRHAIETQLDEPAQSQALNLLEDYLSYKIALYELEKTYEVEQQSAESDPLSITRFQLPLLASRMEAILSARRTHFDSAVVDAFFAHEELSDHYTLAKLKIMQDEALSAETRENQLLQLEKTLPADVRKGRAEVTQYQRYQLAESDLIEQGGTEADIHQLRAREFGDEAAMRLAELDQQRLQWEQRLKVYRKEKALLDSAGLSQEDLTRQISALRHQHFSELEVRRVTALDQIHEG